MDCGKTKMDSSVVTGSLVLVTLILPFSLYTFLDNNLFDLYLFSYGSLIALLSFSSAMLWMKMFLVFSNVKNSIKKNLYPVSKPIQSYPAASAIIAGNLDFEFDDLINTTEAFFDVTYPGKLEVIIAFSAENHSNHAGKEMQLKCLAERMPNRFVLHCVDNVSDQENVVNAAAQIASGDFITIFFAGHYPAPNCVVEAYKWREAQNSTIVKPVHIKSNNSAWKFLTLEVSEGQDVFTAIGSKMENLSVAAAEFLTFLWPKNYETTSGIFARSDLGLSAKSILVFEYMWQRVFPWLALQILPLVAFLCYKHSDLHNLSHLEVNQIAANLMMSSY